MSWSASRRSAGAGPRPARRSSSVDVVFFAAALVVTALGCGPAAYSLAPDHPAQATAPISKPAPLPAPGAAPVAPAPEGDAPAHDHHHDHQGHGS